MKSLHFALRLTPFHRGREGFADGLSVDLASQTEVRAVTGLVGLMTTTVWLSTTTVDGGDRAAAEITQFQQLHEDAGTLLFEGGEGVRQRAPPILTYTYVRIIPAKKEHCPITPYGSHAQSRPSRIPCGSTPDFQLPQVCPVRKIRTRAPLLKRQSIRLFPRHLLTRWTGTALLCWEPQGFGPACPPVGYSTATTRSFPIAATFIYGTSWTVRH
jgi:hypothetical protein